MKYQYANKTALITGASSGIGAEFAKQLAERGMNLILVARSADKLKALAKQIQAEHDCIVSVLPCDLTAPGAAASLKSLTEQGGLRVDMLINNAGFGSYGEFANQSAALQREEIDLNVQSLVELSHTFLTPMIERSDGAIINVASAAAFQATPYMSIYGATKAFVLSFSLGLWSELKSQGVFVHALCPGPVETNFFAASGSKELEENVKKFPMMSVERCVGTCLKSFERGQAFVVPGVSNKLATGFSKITPRQLAATVSGKFIGGTRLT